MNRGLERGNPKAAGISDLFAVPANTTTVKFLHGLGRRPVTVDVTLVCLAADNGYTRGDEIPATFGQIRNNGVNEPALPCSWNETSVTVYRNGTVCQVWPKASSAFGTLTEANWAVRITTT